MLENIQDAYNSGTILITTIILLILGGYGFHQSQKLFQLISEYIYAYRTNKAKEQNKKNLYEIKDISETIINKLDENPIPMKDIIRQNMSLNEIEEFLELYANIDQRIQYMYNQINQHTGLKTQNQKNQKNNNQNQKNNNQNQNQNQNQNKEKDNLFKFLTNQIRKTGFTDENKINNIADQLKKDLKNQGLDMNDNKIIEKLKQGCQETNNQDIQEFIKNNYTN